MRLEVMGYSVEYIEGNLSVNIQTIAKHCRVGDEIHSEVWMYGLNATIIKITDEGVLMRSDSFSNDDKTWFASFKTLKPEWVNWRLIKRAENSVCFAIDE